MTTKAILRAKALHTLTQLGAKRREEAATAAFIFLSTELQNYNVLSFAPTPLEINLWPINHLLLTKHRLILPKVENGCLVPYEVTSLEQLLTSRYNLREPDPKTCRRVYVEEIDLVFVPGLCFDSFFHRIGSGKGYFDKFLKDFPKAVKWGIGFKEQKVAKIPFESHDIKLDKLFLF